MQPLDPIRMLYAVEPAHGEQQRLAPLLGAGVRVVPCHNGRDGRHGQTDRREESETGDLVRHEPWIAPARALDDVRARRARQWQ